MGGRIETIQTTTLLKSARILKELRKSKETFCHSDFSEKRRITTDVKTCKVYYYFYSLRDFHSSVDWWSFSRVWATANPFRFPGFFSIFWVWMVSISNSPSLLSKLLGTVVSGMRVTVIPIVICITIDITVTFMFHSFFLVFWQSPSICQSFHFLYVFRWNSKINKITSSFFLVKSGFLAEIRWSICIAKS